MSSLSHRYKNFDLSTSDGDTALAPGDDEETEAQLSVFENGYQAGWEDAVKACEADSEQAISQICQRLEDMSFTHREAYVKLNAGMKPLMTQIIQKILPEIAQEALGVQIVSEMLKLMEAQSGAAIEIAIAPQNLSRCQAIFDKIGSVPFTLAAEPALSAGQAYLRVNQTEREINLDAALNGMGAALEAFYEQTKEKVTNG